MSQSPTGGANQPALPSEAAAAASERPCPECGEKVRAGMVRCYNCGAFLRKEIADKYAAMQSKPQGIILSEVPAGELHSLGDVDDDGGMELKVIEARSAGQEPSTGYALQTPAKAPSAEAPKPAPASPEPVRSEPADTNVSHSVATAGDVLLQAALSEQADEKKRRKDRGISLRGGARTPGGFVIYCPYGCRIEVKDQHRGMTGSCPKCRAPFIVPVDPPDYGYRERAAEQEAKESSASPTGVWVPWLEDQHLHQVAPEKLKLKVGSLSKEFLEVDLGFSPQGLVLMSYAPKKQAPAFGGGSGTDKKKPDARAAVFSHLKEDKPASEAPANAVRIYKPEELAQMQVAQPAANPLQSMFAGIAVFGEKQIGVQLPLTEGQPPHFLSFGLLGFRKFVEALKSVCGVELPVSGVPMQDDYVDYKCHYTDVAIHALQNLDWYQADPTANVTLAGWKCAACGLAISEEARKKENIGGKGGKAIAKAPCPKCKNKFGEQPLHTLPSQLATANMAEGAAKS